MAESRIWTWQVPALIGEEEEEDEAEENGFTTLRLSLATKGISRDRRLSLPAHVGGGWGSSSSRLDERDICVKLVKLRQALQDAREEFLELRQEASDLQEYSSAKLGRVTRYLGVLAEKTRKHDQIMLDYEARLSVLKKEKSLHFNELVSAKGNVRVLVRVRHKLKSEAPCCISLPDERTVHISNDARGGNAEFQFNQVYGPQVSQAQFFQDIQPFVQSAVDGYNVCIFACGPKASGKTYTMEGPEHDRGMYFRTFEELFDLSNGESTPTSKFSFYVTVLEICDEQIEDLLRDVPSNPSKPQSMVEMECSGPFVQRRVENPIDFARVFKAALQKQNFTGARPEALSSPCLAVTFHVHYANVSTGEKHYSKISLLDVPGAERQMNPDGISKSFSSLVKVVSSLVWKRSPVPFDDSKCTHILSDSLGGDSKTVIVLHINPDDAALEGTKSWLRAAKLCNDDASRTLQNKIFQEQNKELKLEIEKLKLALQESKEMHQKKPVTGSDESSDRSRFDRDQIVQLKTQVVQFAKVDREQKAELASRASKIFALEDKVQELSQQLQGFRSGNLEPAAYVAAEQMGEELSRRDELIESLHQENEKLFQRLTERSTFSPRVPRLEHTRTMDSSNLTGSLNTKPSKRATSPQKRSSSGGSDPGFSTALQTTGVDKPKTTPAGQYLTNALTVFEPDHYNGPAAISDAANKLLMLVLAAVIKAGASREHDLLEEIREAVFAFIRKLEPRKVMDTMLVSRVRVLYVRSLLAKSPELQALKVPPVDQFLKKSGSRSSRASSTGSSPTRSPVSVHSLPRKEVVEDEQGKPLKINLKPERTSRLSSIVLRLRGIDQETWRQQLTDAKLRDLNEEARNYAVGNKRLAALFVHTPAGELQRRIRNWLADSFDFLSLSSGENAGQLELLSTAIMDGWMAGLGIPTRPSTDSLGQLLSDYTKHVYLSQLQSLKDIAGTLATEEAEDLAQVSKIRSALEAIDLKRRKILQQMRHDVALLTKEEGGSPVRCPSTASEEARVASLISLEDIINQAEEIRREAPQKGSLPSKKKSMLSRLTALGEQTSALLSIDHSCAHKFMKQARKAVESASSASATTEEKNSRRRISDDTSSGSGDDVVQWSVLQFNNGADAPFIIKCGANSMMQLVVKAQAGSVAVVPSPPALSGLSLEEIKSVLAPLPEAFRQLAVGRTADGTRARYARLYKTLAVRVPSLRSAVSDAEGLSDGPIARSRGSDMDSYY